MKKGDIFEHKKTGKQFKLVSKSGARWRAVELTHKNDYYASTHSFLEHILRQKFVKL